MPRAWRRDPWTICAVLRTAAVATAQLGSWPEIFALVYELDFLDGEAGAELDAVCLALGGGILDFKIQEAIAASIAAVEELRRLQQIQAQRERPAPY